jgi:hypothetical protein
LHRAVSLKELEKLERPQSSPTKNRNGYITDNRKVIQEIQKDFKHAQIELQA